MKKYPIGFNTRINKETETDKPMVGRKDKLNKNGSGV